MLADQLQALTVERSKIRALLDFCVDKRLFARALVPRIVAAVTGGWSMAAVVRAVVFTHPSGRS